MKVVNALFLTATGLMAVTAIDALVCDGDIMFFVRSTYKKAKHAAKDCVETLKARVKAARAKYKSKRVWGC
jgi:hypothetical protein